MRSLGTDSRLRWDVPLPLPFVFAALELLGLREHRMGCYELGIPSRCEHEVAPSVF